MRDAIYLIVWMAEIRRYLHFEIKSWSQFIPWLFLSLHCEYIFMIQNSDLQTSPSAMCMNVTISERKDNFKEKKNRKMINYVED